AREPADAAFHQGTRVFARVHHRRGRWAAARRIAGAGNESGRHGGGAAAPVRGDDAHHRPADPDEGRHARWQANGRPPVSRRHGPAAGGTFVSGKTQWTVPVGDATTSAVYEPASSGDEAALFVFAHGAGGNMSDRGVLATANALRANGFGVVRFNFLYRERKSGRPDPMPKLMNAFSAVAEHVRAALQPRRLVIGGRSMGGHAASML